MQEQASTGNIIEAFLVVGKAADRVRLFASIMYLANFAIFVLGTAFFRQKYPALPALCIGLAGMAGIIMAIVPGSAQEAKWKRSMNAVSGSVLLALAFLRALAII